MKWATWLVLGMVLTRLGPAEAATSRTLEVTLPAPDSAWSVAIEQVRVVDDELWVLARLSRAEGMALQVISTVADRVEVPADSTLAVRYFILGKTWGWTREGSYTFLKSRDELPARWHHGKTLYSSSGEDSSRFLPFRQPRSNA